MSELKLGIIGTGSIASRFAKAAHLTEGVTPYAVSSRSEEKGRAFASEHDIPHVYLGAEAMLADPNVDLVYVAVPHPFHFENSFLALKAGKAVLCEKPICVSREQTEAIFMEARKRDLFLAEGMWTRYLPTSIAAKRWIQEGRIGRVKFIDGMFAGAMDPEHPTPRLVEYELGGGALFDLGVYTIEMASFYADEEPKEWDGVCVPYRDGVDDSVAMSLKYPGGTLATLRTSISCNAPSTMTIYGDQGRIELPRFFTANDAYLYVNGELQEHVHEDCDLPRGFCWQIAQVRDYLKEGAKFSELIPPESSIRTAEIMEDLLHQFFPTKY